MKVFYIECTEEELRANRGIMDAIVDACSGVLSTFYGTYPVPVAEEQNDTESEEQDSE